MDAYSEGEQLARQVIRKSFLRDRSEKWELFIKQKTSGTGEQSYQCLQIGMLLCQKAMEYILCNSHKIREVKRRYIFFS